MKLVGSKTEQDFREILIKSHNLLFEGNSFQQLLPLLKSGFPDLKTVYIINHIPEQGEDSYIVLVNLDIIAMIEINHNSQDENAILETMNVNKFNKGMSKMEQIKLAVALDLAKNDINSN